MCCVQQRTRHCFCKAYILGQVVDNLKKEIIKENSGKCYGQNLRNSYVIESDSIILLDKVVRRGVSEADLETEIWGHDGTDHVKI